MKTLLAELARLSQRYDVRDVYVFGSRAPDVAARVAGGAEPTPLAVSDSDLDVGVQLSAGRTLTARERVRLAGALEELFEIVAERAAWVREMLAGLRALPLGSYQEFASDPASAESFFAAPWRPCWI